MKIKSKILAGIAVLAITIGGIAATSSTAYAEDPVNLGDVVILSQLFGGGSLGATTARSVTVQSGDTLSGIAATFLGNANLWPSIASLNNLSNPNLIFPGEVLTLPAATLNNGGNLFGNNSLGNLLILDQLFGGNGNVLGGGVLGGSGSSLGNLLILNQLFGGSGNIFGGGMMGGNNSLGNLLILDGLFGGNGGIFGNGVLGGSGSSLGNLLILNQLFGGNMNNL